MRTYIHLLLFGLLISFSSYISAYTAEFYERTIHFVGDHSYPPYEYNDEEGRPAGFNIEILKAVAAEIGLDIKITLLPWYEALEAIKTGEADAITGMLYSIERARHYHFSRPHCFVDMSIVVPASNTDIRTEENLYGKAIVVQQNDILHEYALIKEFTDQLFTVPDPDQGLIMLAEERVDAGLFPEIPSKYIAVELEINNLSFINGFILRKEYCFATLHENSHLNSILNEGLMALKESGKYWDIYDKWLGEFEDTGITPETVFRYVVISLLVLGLVGLIIIVWMLSLKSNLKRNTQQLNEELEAHRKTTAELQDSTDRFKYLVDNVPELIFEADNNGKILFANKNITKTLGYTPEEAGNLLKLDDFIHPSETEKLETFYKRLKETGNSVIQISGITKSNTEVQLIIYSGLKHLDDEKSRILGIAVDFTYQWKEENLKKVIYQISELTHDTKDLDQLYKQIHRLVGLLMPTDNFYIALYDEKTELLSFPYFIDQKDEKPKTKKMGYGMTEYVMRKKEAVLATKQDVNSLQENGELEPIGMVPEIWIGAPLIVDGKVIGLVAVQDYSNPDTYSENDKKILTFVSEQIAAAILRKQNEEIIFEKTVFFDELLHNIPVGIVLVDRDDTIIDANQAFLDMFGYKYEEVHNKPVNSLIIPEDYGEEADHYSRTTQQSKTVSAETVRRKKDGELINVRLYGVPVVVDGKQEAIYGIYVDITELQQTRISLAEERDRLQVMLSSIGDGVIATDHLGRIVLMNQVATDLTGISEKKAIGRPIEKAFRIFNELTGESIDSIVKKVLETKEIMHLSNHTVLRSHNGENYIIEDSAAPIIDENGQLIGVILVFRDSTEKKRLEIELQRTAKLESIGILAGGIAHDFNNILTSIIGNITLARKTCNKKNIFDVDRKLKEAEKASLRARKLTQQLLTYSKGGEPVKSTASVKEILEETVDFATIGSNITTGLKIDDDIWNIEVDAGQIGQVINNLAINAVQAMPNGGSLTITASNCNLECEKYKSLKPGKYVVIKITDTGEGIDRQTLNKIFDPFFTTKSKGTGLGLTTSIGIIKNHNGYLTVDSKSGKGSTFTIYLPATEKKPKDKVVMPVKESCSGQVLLMDDDQSLAGVVTEMLETLGYSVTVAKNGEEAVSIYKTMLHKKNKPDVVILDLTIPGGMGGKDVVKELLKIEPEANCVVSSGYSSDPIMARYKEYGFKGVLAKPYSFKELANTLAKFSKSNV